MLDLGHSLCASCSISLPPSFGISVLSFLIRSLYFKLLLDFALSQFDCLFWRLVPWVNTHVLKPVKLHLDPTRVSVMDSLWAQKRAVCGRSRSPLLTKTDVYKNLFLFVDTVNLTSHFQLPASANGRSTKGGKSHHAVHDSPDIHLIYSFHTGPKHPLTCGCKFTGYSAGSVNPFSSGSVV